MAQPSVVGCGGESTAVDMPSRLLPTPFLTKTYQLVEDQAVDDVISWNADGSTFIVWNPTEFARDLLPKYFKHNNFSSFIRQLNTYGFRKVMPDRWEFSNDCFRRGEKSLLCDIQRRKIATPPSITPLTAAVEAAVQPTLFAPPLPVSSSDSGEEQVLSSSISPAAFLECSGNNTSELMGENDRLRKENVHLNRELSHMKSICNNIFILMSNYSSSSENNSGNGYPYQEDSCKSSLTEMKPLDLLPMTSYCKEAEIGAVDNNEGGRNTGSCPEAINASLFGVPLPIGGTKRERESSGTPAAEEMDLQLQQPGRGVKFEPLDRDKAGDNQGPWWTRG